MTCNKNECLQEAGKKCKTCTADYCDDHIKYCEGCKSYYCDAHLDKHECKDNEEDDKKVVAAKKSKTESNNTSHSVALRKSGGIDINTFNKIDTVLEIHHIDVGQGDSTLILIKSFKGEIYKSILIDAGISSKPIIEYFERLLKKGKEESSVSFRPIDILIITHGDKDHVSGASDILKNDKYANREATLYDIGKPTGKYESPYEAYLNCAKEQGFVRKRPPVGGIILEEKGVVLRCLACNGVMSNIVNPKEEGPYYHLEIEQGLSKELYKRTDEMQLPLSYYPRNINNLSIALHLTFGKFSYFTAGDLSDKYEEHVAYIIANQYGPVSAWKAGHHGAGECTSEKVAGYLQGRICVFSFGTANSYGHPFQAPIDHLEALNLAKVPCDYFCTGEIIESSNPNFKYGELGGHGYDNQGTIIISAIESEVMLSEKFHVDAEKYTKTYELKPNRAIPYLEIPASKNKHIPQKKHSEEENAEKADRKEQRIKEKQLKARELLIDEIINVIKKDQRKDMTWKEITDYMKTRSQETRFYDELNYQTNALAELGMYDKGRYGRSAQEVIKKMR